MAPQWFLARNRAKLGPYSVEQLRAMAAAGQLLPGDMLLQVGAQKWVPASSIVNQVACAPIPSPSPAAGWFYALKGETVGPVTEEVLLALIRGEALQPRDLVWTPGMPAWTPAAQCFRFPARADTVSARPADPSGPKFPGAALAAGIIWVVLGGLLLFGTLTFSVLVPLLGEGADLAELLVLPVILGLIGGAFILVGVQTVRGTAPGTVGNGVGSILFGLPYAWAHWDPLGAAAALALLVAGVLALVSNSEYRVWRKARKVKRAGRP